MRRVWIAVSSIVTTIVCNEWRPRVIWATTEEEWIDARMPKTSFANANPPDTLIVGVF